MQWSRPTKAEGALIVNTIDHDIFCAQKNRNSDTIAEENLRYRAQLIVCRVKWICFGELPNYYLA